MGYVYSGIPKRLALSIKRKYNIRTFIETGTHLGATAKWAASNFDEVYTIEASKEYYDSARENLKEFQNVHVLFGESAKFIGNLVKTTLPPRLFWLDAHFNGSSLSAGKNEECGVLQELQQTGNQGGGTDWILIDDARYFLSPPANPHDIKQWPTIADIVRTLQTTHHIENILVFDDVIICPPDEERFSDLRNILSNVQQKLYFTGFIRRLTVLKRDRIHESETDLF